MKLSFLVLPLLLLTSQAQALDCKKVAMFSAVGAVRVVEGSSKPSEVLVTLPSLVKDADLGQDDLIVMSGIFSLMLTTDLNEWYASLPGKSREEKIGSAYAQVNQYCITAFNKKYY